MGNWLFFHSVLIKLQIGGFFIMRTLFYSLLVVLLVVFVFSGFSLSKTSSNIVGFTDNHIRPIFQKTEDTGSKLIAGVTDLESDEGTLKSEGVVWYKQVNGFFSEMFEEIGSSIKDTKDMFFETEEIDL